MRQEKYPPAHPDLSGFLPLAASAPRSPSPAFSSGFCRMTRSKIFDYIRPIITAYLFMHSAIHVLRYTCFHAFELR